MAKQPTRTTRKRAKRQVADGMALRLSTTLL